MPNGAPTDPIENIKNFFLPLLKLFLQYYQIGVLILGVGFILLLGFLIFFENALGF